MPYLYVALLIPFCMSPPAMPDLIRLVHGSSMGLNRLIKTFQTHWAARTHTGDSTPGPVAARTPDTPQELIAACGISKRQLERKITAIAVKEHRPPNSKPLWFVHDTVLQQQRLNGKEILALNTHCRLSPPETPSSSNRGGEGTKKGTQAAGGPTVKSLFAALTKATPPRVAPTLNPGPSPPPAAAAEQGRPQDKRRIQTVLLQPLPSSPPPTNNNRSNSSTSMQVASAAPSSTSQTPPAKKRRIEPTKLPGSPRSSPLQVSATTTTQPGSRQVASADSSGSSGAKENTTPSVSCSSNGGNSNSLPPPPPAQIQAPPTTPLHRIIAPTALQECNNAQRCAEGGKTSKAQLTTPPKINWQKVLNECNKVTVTVDIH